jgi:environmental stress-induced protein Ves
MTVRRLTRADYRRMPWRNGGGWTTEIAREPAGDHDTFDWRVSIADIARDAGFSRYEGVDRCLVLLEGAGMELRVAGAPTLLDRRGQSIHFAGEADVDCRLLDGPTRDLNVFTRRGRCAQRVLFRPLLGPMVLLAEPGVVWLVHVVAGSAHEQHRAEGIEARAGETLLVEPNAGQRPCMLAGGGELLLVRLAREP